MIFSSKRKKFEQLKSSFGQLKNDLFYFEQIEKYYRNTRHDSTIQELNDKTCNDLDLHELFLILDRTESRVGQQYLYNKLRSISFQKGEVFANEDLIEEFSKNEGFRFHIQKQLSKLNHQDAYYITSLFQETHIKPPKWFFLCVPLSVTCVISLILLAVNLKMFIVVVAVYILNLIIHYWNKRNLYQYLNSIPQLLQLNKVAINLFSFEKLKKLNLNLDESISIINKVRNRMSFFKLEANFQSDTEAIVFGLMELVKIMFLVEPILLFSVLKKLDSKRKEIEELYKFVGEIDCLISIASLREGLPHYCIPNFIEDEKLIQSDHIYHPLIHDCISNSFKVKDKSVLLTGSNMSGKTSFIRTVAINAIVGQTMNTCFATHFSMPKMKILSAIRISDDLLDDKSYYFEEVLTIKDMIDAGTDKIPHLFLLDEIFKGTNTIERISAGAAVLSALAKNGNIVFVSTHDIELAGLLKEEYDLYHFSEKVGNKTVDFDYKLKLGKLKRRNAIRILQLNNYPNEVVEKAFEIAQELDKMTVVEAE